MYNGNNEIYALSASPTACLPSNTLVDTYTQSHPPDMPTTLHQADHPPKPYQHPHPCVRRVYPQQPSSRPHHSP
jgi:hypothetical protein